MDRAGESDEPHHPLTADSVCERNGASSRVGDASFFFYLRIAWERAVRPTVRSAFFTCTTLGALSCTGEKFHIPRLPAATSMSAHDWALALGTVGTARRRFILRTRFIISDMSRMGTPCSV